MDFRGGGTMTFRLRLLAVIAFYFVAFVFFTASTYWLIQNPEIFLAVVAIFAVLLYIRKRISGGDK